MRIRLIILDFDGTLADTRMANYRAYAAALAEAGVQIEREKYLSYYFGMRCPEFLRELGFDDEAEIDRIRRRKIELYPSFFDSVRINEPLWNFCLDARRGGCKLWIVSTGQPQNIANAMRYLGIEADIDGVITSADVANPKPAPDAFLLAMRRAGVTPAETLVFEDSRVGIEAAEACGAAYFKVTM